MKKNFKAKLLFQTYQTFPPLKRGGLGRGDATFPPMLRVFGWFFRWVSLAALLCLTIAILRVTSEHLMAGGWKALFGASALWIAAAGFGVRVLLSRVFGENPFEFLDTLEHELTHAITGYLTFAPPMSLTATLREGGEVELPRRNPIAVLSPYFLPLYATFVALLTLVMKSNFLPYGRYAVAFLLGGFVYRFCKEFHLGQTDFTQYGFVFSLCFVAVLLPLSFAGILETSRLVHLPWHNGIWHLFVEQGKWFEHLVIGRFTHSG